MTSSTNFRDSNASSRRGNNGQGRSPFSTSHRAPPLEADHLEANVLQHAALRAHMRVNGLQVQASALHRHSFIMTILLTRNPNTDLTVTVPRLQHQVLEMVQQLHPAIELRFERLAPYRWSYTSEVAMVATAQWMQVILLLWAPKCPFAWAS